MKNVLVALVFLSVLTTTAFAQDNHTSPRSLGVSFILNDFTTPQRIRSSSFEQVRRDKRWAKIQEMSPGIALTYFKGIKNHIDFAGTLTGSFVNYPMRNRAAFEKDALLLEADATANFKMFDDSYWFTPYLTAGVGASKFRAYYGAYVPLGLGLRLNIFDEASVFIQSQYRIPVTYETTNYHLTYGIGVSGIIGKNRK